MQSELCLRLLGPACLPRKPNYDPIADGLARLNLDLNRDSVDCYSNITRDPYTHDDLWFLQSCSKVLHFIDNPSTGFSDWYLAIEFGKRREILEFSLQVFHFQPLLQDLLDMCGFFGTNLDLAKYRRDVSIVLFKYIQSKFNLRPRLSDPDHHISHICLRIAKCRIRLNAELARLRVDQGAANLRDLLGEESRQQLEDQANTVLCIRTTKLWSEALESCDECSIDLILHKLGLVRAANSEEVLDVSHASNQFKYLILRADLVAVSSNSYPFFSQHHLTREGYIQLLDLSSYNLITHSNSHLDLTHDIILTHFASGAECIQISESLNTEATVHAFNVENMCVARAKLSQYKINNVKLYQKDFSGSDGMMTSLSDVKSVICLPPNSQSSIRSKLIPALTDVSSLSSLFRPSDPNLIDALASQRNALATSLGLGQVDEVLYFVLSSVPSECQELVRSGLLAHTEQTQTLKQRSFTLKSVTHDTYYPDSEGFLTVDATDTHHGYFVASLHRNPPPPAPKPVEVIEKAFYDGILPLSDSEYADMPVKKPKHKKCRQKPLFSSSKESIPMTFTAKQKITKKHVFTSNLNDITLHNNKPFR